MIVTLKERKEVQVARIRSGLACLRIELSDYARRNGGHFWLYGSAASGDVRYDSDIDILADFEPNLLSAALMFAEDACARLGLKPNMMPKSWCRDAFIHRIVATAVVLP